ncbi:MAG: tetratricopeptide repeat protein [Planctomycetota bacterium]|nr:MAG: tetratricopeptide repeat protein [Planctomycetota bacterium]
MQLPQPQILDSPPVPAGNPDRALPVAFRRLIEAVIVAAVAAALMSGVVGGAFVSDDELLIENNELVRDLRNIPAIFQNAYFPKFRDATGAYRPLTTVTYALNYAISGKDTRGFQITNIALHALASILVFVLFLRLFPPGPFAFLGGLAFASTAVHVDAVAWISGRPEVLCTVFMLLTFHLFLSFRKGPSWWYIAPIFLLNLGAVLSKETGLIFLVVLIGFDLLLPGEEKRSRRLFRSLPVYAAVAAGVVIFLLLRHRAIGDFSLERRLVPLIFLSLPERMLFMGKVFIEWLRLLVAPIHLSVDYSHLGNPVFSYGSHLEILGWLLAAGVVVLSVFAGRRRPVIGWMLLAAAIFLIPVSQVIPIGVILSERSLYVPSIFFLGALAFATAELHKQWGTSREPRRRAIGSAAVIAFITIVIVGAAPTWSAASSYRNDFDLWKRAVSAEPKSARLWDNLAAALLKRNEIDSAINAARLAVAREPLFAPAHTTLGMAYVRLAIFEADEDLRRERYRNAEAEFQCAISLPVPDNIANLEYGALLVAKERFEEALPLLQEALGLALNPRRSYGLFAQALAGAGRYGEALAFLREAKQKYPLDSTFVWLEGIVKMRKGDLEAAVEDFRAALEFHGMARTPEYLVWLAEAYYKLGRDDEALEVYGWILRITHRTGESFTARRFRALINIRRRNFEDAHYDLKILEEAFPGDPDLKALQEKLDAAVRAAEEEKKLEEDAETTGDENK